jgi:flagellar hook-associated protein 1 FlgK
VGEEGAEAAGQFETREQVLIAAQNLRDSLSAVDVNEEAARLLQFEQSYQAMLRVIQVVDGLVSEILRLVP